MHKSAQGMLYLRNFDTMPEAMAEDLLRVVRAIEHKQVVQEKFHRLLPRVLVLGTSKTVDDLQDQRRRGLGELLDEIGEELTIPTLNERLDLDYVIRSVIHDIDAEKIITVEAERMLSQHYWVSGSGVAQGDAADHPQLPRQIYPRRTSRSLPPARR